MIKLCIWIFSTQWPTETLLNEQVTPASAKLLLNPLLKSSKRAVTDCIR